MKIHTTHSCISCLLGLAAFTIASVAHSETQTVKVSNTEGKPLAISSIKIDGQNPTSFSQTNNCGKSLGVGKSCTVDVKFVPTSPGLKQATLIVRNSHGNLLTVPVSLSGTGVANEATRTQKHQDRDKEGSEDTKGKDSHKDKSNWKVK